MRPGRAFVLLAGIPLALGTVIFAQQHSYTQAEIEAGSKLYDSNCGSCHGENGDKVTGIDFGKNTFKTARTDEDIARIARSGVPNTGMPPNPGLTEAQAGNLVAFVRSLVGGRAVTNAGATALTGDSTRGKTIFEGKGTCTTCHAVNGVGGTSGPDLGAPAGGRGGGGRGGAPGVAAAPPVPAPPAAGAPAAAGGGRGGRGGGAGGRGGAGAPAGPPAAGAPPAAAAQGRGGGGGGGRGGNAPNPQQIERSIVDPNAEIAPQYRTYQVVTKANVTASGTLLNQDTFSVQMRDSNDKLMSYWKTDLKEFAFKPSAMPSFKDKLTPQEIADVVSYLVSLRSN
jgi:mono/diheme cytochrome c family protein